MNIGLEQEILAIEKWEYLFWNVVLLFGLFMAS